MVNKEKVPKELKFTLENLRTRKGLTQRQVADVLGISKDTYGKLERDSHEITMRQVEILEQYYGVPRDYIFLGKSNAFYVI